MAGGLFEREVSLSGLWARVVLERGIDQSDGLTYAVPSQMADLQPGERVRAPLGRGDKPAEGYVVEVFPAPTAVSSGPGIGSSGLDPARVKPLLGRVDRGGSVAARLTPCLVRLASWISGYYCTPMGMVLSTIVPSAVKKQVGRVTVRLLDVSVEAHGELDVAQKLPASAREAWGKIRELPIGTLPLPPRDLADRLGLKTTAALGRLVKAGLLIFIERGEVRARGDGGGWGLQPERDTPPPLSSEQAAAVGRVVSSLRTFRGFLLHGVTGSGKTEVYLRALETALAHGPAIVLVPEIALTPQTSARFLSRFGAGTVAVLHSGLSEAQRHHEWSRVASGKARIVVGARSAVFAPCPERVSLIIVDEEHDGSYKQDQLPRYHARDVALRRGQLEGCPVVLGSATPSLESWHNALSDREGGAGRFERLSMPRRVGGGRLPPVEIVDMVEAQRQRPRDRRQHALSPRLEHEIARTLEGSGQIILLLNRRGFASYVCCSDATCGWFLQCKHCDVTAVYHRERAAARETLPVVKCHHCMAEQRLPSLCPACGKTVNLFGFGTQRVEEEIRRTFPALAREGAMLRLDADSMRRAADYFEALERFRAGDARCLLGTQMIAKGLDFPGVELIGVINADTGLSLPDFRASERTFQLVSQVAGRAGRSGASARASRVVVQTMAPHEPAITLAASHDFERFASRELEFRREAGLPPVGRMARVVCRDEKPEKAEARAHEVASALRAAASSGASAGEPGAEPSLRVKGPMPCPIARVAGQYRFAVEVLGENAWAIQRALASVRSAGLVRSDAHTAVDVDPLALL